MSSHRERSSNMPRREFLAAMAAGAAAGVATRPLGASPQVTAAPQSWRLRLSASSINLQDLPVEQVCQRIAELGFDAIDIWSAHDGCPHLDDVLNRLGPEGLQHVLKEHKLELGSFSVYRGGYRRYARLLGQLGGGLAVQGSTRPCEPAELLGRMGAYLKGLQAEVELAEEQDSYLAIENHGHALLNSLDSLKAFVDMNRSPRLGIALAPYHLQALNASVEEAIDICGRQLFFFYAWQRADGMDQLPGHGPVDFSSWIAALAKAEYRGHVNPFMHGDVDPPAMARALARSRDYLIRCDKRRKVSGS
jgi:sugar phosphate isomerase/epimerase